MKRKATSEIDDLCSAVKKMKLENCSLLKCQVCDGVYPEEEFADECTCLDCFDDNCYENEDDEENEDDK